MTERVTETYPCDLCNVEFCYRRCYKMTLWAEKAKEKLAEYETAEEEGRLVVIPYKIGMTLFLPRRGEVLPFKVVGTRIYTNRTEIDLVYFGNNECYKFLSAHPTTEFIEREFYKTSEETEKALKEMEEK